MRRNHHLLFGIVGASALLFSPAVAQEAAKDWPSQTVTIVVGAGGTNDLVARLIASKRSQNLGANFIVENKPGAGTAIGTAHVAKSAPDGYTLLSTSASFTAAPLMFQTSYDSKTDLTPIAQFIDGPFLLVAHTSLKVKTFKEYVDHLKQNPGKINWGSLAGQQDIGGRWLDKITGTVTVNVPYKEASQMYSDVLSGHTVHASMIQASSIIQHARSGAVQALAWTGTQRNALLLDLPTIAELGYPEFNVSLWQGLFGPKELSSDLTARISAEVAKIVKGRGVFARTRSA